MRKFILLVVVSLMGGIAMAQSVSVPEGKHPVYCELVGYNFWGAGKVKARLDMGRKVPNREGFEYIYEDGKKKKFNTMMEVLNYMAKRGWTVHSSYVVSEGMSHNNVLHFLLIKFITSDEEIEEGLELSDKD